MTLSTPVRDHLAKWVAVYILAGMLFLMGLGAIAYADTFVKDRIQTAMKVTNARLDTIDSKFIEAEIRELRVLYCTNRAARAKLHDQIEKLQREYMKLMQQGRYKMADCSIYTGS